MSLVRETPAGSGGADLDGCPKAHAPCAEEEDGRSACAEHLEGSPVKRLKELVAFEALDAAPLVAARESGAEL